MNDNSEKCWLCERPLGEKVEKHHIVPKSLGGKETVPLHPICHRKLHTLFNEKELAMHYHNRDRLLANADINKFLKWVENKDPDFYTSTYHKKQD